jgi:hypothetical protein
MNLTPIEAIEGKLQEWLDPSARPVGYEHDENIYRLHIPKDTGVQVNQQIWLGEPEYGKFPIKGMEEQNTHDFLFQGIVLEIEEQEEYHIILFQLQGKMNKEDILLYCPESPYPEHLEENIRSEHSACNYMQNAISIYKGSADSYSLNVDFYGCITSIEVRVIDGKMYAWYTSIGFLNLRKAYYGKYLVSEWLQEKIEHPLDDHCIMYSEEGT